MKKSMSAMLSFLFLYSVSGLHAAEQHANTALGPVSGPESSSSSLGMDGLLNRVSQYAESRAFLFARKPKTVAEYAARVNLGTALGIQRIVQDNPIQNKFRHAAMLAQIDETIAAKREESRTKPKKQKVSERSDIEATESDYQPSDASDDERTETDEEYDAPVRGKRKRASQQSSGKKSAKEFRCDNCSKGFTRANNLKRHQDTVHKRIKRYGCSKKGLELVAGHNDVVPHHTILQKIQFCGAKEKSFAEKHHLVSHLLSHLSKQGIYKYTCECGQYKGNDLSNFNRHRKNKNCSMAS